MFGKVTKSISTKTFDRNRQVNYPTQLNKSGTDLYEKIFARVFSPMRLGQLMVILPNGGTKVYGNNDGHVRAQINVRDWKFFKKCVFFGDIGFGESYVDGDWETPDITKVIEWMIVNVEHHPTMMADKKKKVKASFLKVANNLLTFFRRNSIKGSRQNIHDHYDLGNDFFKIFLDPTMAYSSAYFKNEKQSLYDAQHEKFEQLCRKIQLKPTDHLLEIGTGWGGLAAYAAKNFYCKVTTVTISEEQYAYAKQKMEREDLSGQVEVKLLDYRKITGKYDKIVSVEMIEAVGAQYYNAFFAQCHNLLKKDGILALQAILCPDHRFESFKNNIDWIQKHIFPGSLLPSLSAIIKSLNNTGSLNLFDFEDITPSYVKTLAAWHQAFNERVGQIREMGFDQAFVRKWNYYWCYCMAAFKTRNISVAHLIFTRPNNATI